MSHTRLRSPRRFRRLAEEPNPLFNWLSVSVFALIALGIVAIVWSSYSSGGYLRKWEGWPTTSGHASATRMVEHADLLGRSTVFRWYARECRVEYVVQGRQHSIWVEVARNMDKKEIEDPVYICPSGSYEVHYDPSDPSEAHITAPR